MWCLLNCTGTPATSSRQKIELTASDRRPRSMCTTSLPRAPLTPSCGPCSIARYCGWSYGRKHGKVNDKHLICQRHLLIKNDLLWFLDGIITQLKPCLMESKQKCVWTEIFLFIYCKHALMNWRLHGKNICMSKQALRIYFNHHWCQDL